MCGIVGYVGYREALPILVEGIRRLEYRGYDSTGLMLTNSEETQVFKKKGNLSFLEEEIKNHKLIASTCGIAHSRWATHGAPSDVNAHPHKSQSGKISIVHNGIIENYSAIKKVLEEKGFDFVSETDSEVLVNLVQYIMDSQNEEFSSAVRLALNEVHGAYAIALMHEDYPDSIVVARLGSPLSIGIGKGEFFAGSDPSPYLEYTNNVVYLEDGQMASISLSSGLEVIEIQNNAKIEANIQELNLSLDQIEKGDFEHFMLKEIFEQPKSIRDTLRGRLLVEEGIVKLSGIWDNLDRISKVDRIIIIACGTSWHSGLVGEYLIEEFSRIPVEVEYASEFRYRNPIITDKDVVVAISQSGETADTIAAIKLAKKKGAFIYGICNVVGSTIARLSDTGTYTHAGPEIGVASTKAFTTQLVVLSLMAINLGKHKGHLSNTDYRRLISELDKLPQKIEEVIERTEALIKDIGSKFQGASNFLYMGRGYNFPIALEGALKLKEISYIHAEGYPAAEMKHGPIALIDENMPVVIVAPKNGQYDKIVSNVQEIKARKGVIIAVVNYGDQEVSQVADYVVEIPETSECFSPIMTVLPLQLLAYYIAVYRGTNIDQPKNLAKSVTVE